jgi:hypothetical protein
MNEMTSICGLWCNECGAFIATRNDDDEKRAEVARLWSEQYNHDIEPADINCLGCTSDSERLFSYCEVCQIRKCAKKKQVKNCAYCDDYPCDKLGDFFRMAPEAREHLDAIRDRF